ncbi:MAG: riboflavin synthase [Melioribacteraceae bacterium]
MIEEIGKLAAVEIIPGGKRFKITAGKIFDDLKIDDSVSVNGVCLTVTGIEGKVFFCDAVGETLTKSTHNDFKPGTLLNIERAIRMNDRLGGHLVQGHVNGTGVITGLTRLGENYSLDIEIPAGLTKYIVDEGSVAIDGISLTVARITDRKIVISVIPHTWKSTNISSRKKGDKVNIETDILAKYIEKILLHHKDDGNKFSDNWFKNLGY